jgi:Protein of unknown function (DUF3040)
MGPSSKLRDVPLTVPGRLAIRERWAMSSLSAREQRILTEIEHDLAAAEPRLEQALSTVRLPAFRFRSAITFDQDRFRWRMWLMGMIATLLCGIGLLTAGIIIDSFPLIFAGIPLAQFSPFAFGYLIRKRFRTSR